VPENAARGQVALTYQCHHPADLGATVSPLPSLPACPFFLSCPLGGFRDHWGFHFLHNCKAMQNNTEGSGRQGDTAGDEEGEWD
jgi:hypothetical protein